MIRTIERAREVSMDHIEQLAFELRKQCHATIVFTNGCFDILHPGHLRFLHCAAGYGDALIVGVNTDQSVRINKGPSRPIMPLAARAHALTCLRFVDIVVPFDEKTPEELVRRVHPHILIKGAEYEEHEIVGGQYADRVLRLPMLKDWSTTGIVEGAVKAWIQSRSNLPTSISSS